MKCVQQRTKKKPFLIIPQTQMLREVMVIIRQTGEVSNFPDCNLKQFETLSINMMDGSFEVTDFSWF